MDTECWNHPELEVRPSPIAGQGLFAIAPIAMGAVVATLGGRLVNTVELIALLADSRPTDSISIADDLHLVLPDHPRPAIAYGNHSCDPNLWWIDAVTLVARCDLPAGAELTSDYGTSTAVADFTMPCTCGSARCRGQVTGRDWCIPELQQRYGDHWIPLLRDRIAAARGVSPQR